MLMTFFRTQLRESSISAISSIQRSPNLKNEVRNWVLGQPWILSPKSIPATPVDTTANTLPKLVVPLLF